MLPSMLNVTKEMSTACGSPNVGVFIFCYGEDDIMSAWSRLLDERNISDANECISKTAWNDFVEELTMGDDERFPGKARDTPAPSYYPSWGQAFTLMPQSWLEENWDTFKENFLTGDEYYSFGGAATTASDQANALSQAHRDAATNIGLPVRDENFWTNLFPQMFSSSDKTNFPPVANSNHAAGVGDFGPLKEDWTKPCPDEYTLEMRDAKCISFQEFIYGTERLKRLEEIKLAVDPDFMFDCDYCILNNRPKSATVQEDNEGGEGGGDVILADGENNSVSLGVSSSFVLSVLLLATVLQW